jgi:methionyl-tRNA synthetase
MGKMVEGPGTKMVHFIGKDNIVFHCIIFPAMLKAEGSYILPTMSRPTNPEPRRRQNLDLAYWAVWLHEYLDEFPGKEDVLKYFNRQRPGNQRQRLYWKDFQARNNNELVAILEIRKPGAGAYQ